MPDFLLEIGVEEIPARMIDGAREELARRVSDLLQRERLAESAAVQAYSTPSRCNRTTHRPLAKDCLQGRRAYSRRGSLRPQGRGQRECAGEGYDSQGRISCRHRAEEGKNGQRDSLRVASQRNRRTLLGEEHVL